MRICVSLQLDFSLAPKTDAPVYLHDQAVPLVGAPLGPFVRNAKGELVGLDQNEACISADSGKSWRRYPIFQQAGFECSNSRSLLCLRSGVLILSFANMAQSHFNWHRKTNLPTKNTFLHHWITRSLDGGRSWEAPQRVLRGYAAAMTSAIQLHDGTVLLSSQNLDYDNGRHYALTLLSKDEGQTWQASNRLDIGGRGHHGGCYEGTLAQLADGRVWYCIRTNQDWFWHAYSADSGLTWTEIHPGLAASSSPGMLTCLKSGRLLLTYNPLQSLLDETRRAEKFRRGGLFSEVAASWFREELAICYSEDEGLSWSCPVVIAQCDKAWLSYPYVCEVEPGKLWITTMQSQLKLEIAESAILGK
ncbi:sialidase family protein [Thiomicrorhabdus cannonii]|uniref:sialidase family protein n=1 Tax=Thiomicrorhabdus cannonii TaxID=2748011 RepID=UPI0015C10BE2|nr:sialidase family protein [Thiomicrorhabdus cannonii]